MRIVRSFLLAVSILVLVTISFGGFLVAPELRRSVAEAALRHITTSTERSSSGKVLETLVNQIVSPPTLAELLWSSRTGAPSVWPRDILLSLTDVLVASLVVGPGEAALRLSERLPHLTQVLPADLLSSESIQLSTQMENLLTALRDRAHLIREEQILAEEVDRLQSACRLLRSDLAISLELGDQSSDGSPCQAYQAGPLAGLPRLKPLRAEPTTPLAFAQLLRAAGSTVDPNEPRTMKRLSERFADIQAAFAPLMAKITSATMRLTDNQGAQRSLSSATFVQQERFISALLALIHELRTLPVHRQYGSITERISASAVKLTEPD